MRASTRSLERPSVLRAWIALRARWLQVRVAALLVATVAFAVACPAHAHKASDAYLQLDVLAQRVDLRWDIALRDLDAALDLDLDGDRRLSWGEVTGRMDDILAYALARLRLQQGRCAFAPAGPPAVDDRIDGAYLVLRLQAPCDAGDAPAIDYRLFREIDPTHRGLLRVSRAGVADAAPRSLDPSGGPVALAWGSATAAGNSDADAAGSLRAGRGFFRDGVHHILIGWDHVLFLLSLLLPSVLLRRSGVRVPVERWREALWPMLGMVSSFTLAHSLTLALAALHVVELSPRIVEPAIAVTIVLAAIDNLRPLLAGGRRTFFCFVFGLVHGFGFAGALAELDLPVLGFVTALVEFNLGVEAGQLLVVCTALGVLMTLRRWTHYEGLVLKAGSVAALAVATIWFVERAFDIAVMPA